jgi:DUF4097 and DUF4098 domain-containing protein YvlB
MDDERRRILQMLTEGTISVDECDELLRALSQQRTRKAENEVAAAKSERRVWPYVLLAILGVIAVAGLVSMFSIGNVFIPLRVGGRLGLLLLVFWIWMLVDCLTRTAFNFRLLFTEKHEHEKWIWIGIVVLAGWVGALVYFIVIRQPSRRVVTPRSSEGQGPAPELPVARPAISEGPFTPWPRARSLIPFFAVALVTAFLGAVAVQMSPHLFADTLRPVIGESDWQDLKVAAPFVAAFAFGGIMMMWVVVFHIWMLVDCIARDRREFGTLITSEKSLDKLLWLLLIFVFPIFGGFAYHLSIRRRIRPEAKRPDSETNLNEKGKEMTKVNIAGAGVIVAVVAALALGGCIIIDTHSSWQPTAKADRTETLSAPISQGALLVAKTHNGKISVTGEERQDCSVVATIYASAWSEEKARELAAATKVELETSDGKLYVKISQPEFLNNCSVGVNLTISVPKETRLQLESHNGGITLADIAGDVKGTTHNGPVKAARVSGRMDLVTHNGSVTGEELRGDMLARTHNGKVFVAYSQEAPGALDVNLETHNGGITFTPPPELSVVANISTHNGKIYTDVPLTVKGKVDDKLQGTIGKGEGKLVLTTHNGSIKIN